MGFSFRRPHRIPESREQMIADTSAFLSQALRQHRPDLRIPTRRVDQGGFAPLLRRSPVARAAVRHWWYRALSVIDA